MPATSAPHEPGSDLHGRVRRTVEADAAAAGVELVVIEHMEPLQEISALFGRVWGRTAEGVPLHSEAMRSIIHAGGMVNAAHDRAGGQLVGAAVLGRDVPGGCYSFLTAVRPGLGDRGIGRALKQHQRAWALGQGLDVMGWTFDPLVARNARFNLTRLGVTVQEYEAGFYGQMADDLNGTDVGDRLVARWELRSSRALAAGQGLLPDPLEDPVRGVPDPGQLLDGPDGEPALVLAHRHRWIRVPTDVVALRAADPALAQAWRTAGAAWFQDAFAAGLVADGMSRSGWYHLTNATPGATA